MVLSWKPGGPQERLITWLCDIVRSMISASSYLIRFCSALRTLLSRFMSGTWLVVRLIYLLGPSLRAYVMLVRLLCFAMLISIKFLPVLCTWLSPAVRTFSYGPHLRNSVDVYFPRSTVPDRKVPLVFGVTGGAWIIGYKLWLGCMGRKLAQDSKCLFVSIDYRNFPDAVVSEMISDIAAAVRWGLCRAEAWGYDITNVTLLGQSAGAHLVALLLMQPVGWVLDFCEISRIKRFIGISGPYDLEALVDSCINRGLPEKMFRSLVGGPLSAFSPIHLLGKSDFNPCSFPPTVLLHGTADLTVPVFVSESFSHALNFRGVQCRSYIFDGVSHTDLILEMLLEEDFIVLQIIYDSVFNSSTYIHKRKKAVYSAGWLSLARFVNPF